MMKKERKYHQNSVKMSKKDIGRKKRNMMSENLNFLELELCMYVKYMLFFPKICVCTLLFKLVSAEQNVFCYFLSHLYLNKGSLFL